MNPSSMRPRTSPATLGQLMAAVGSVAALCALVATVRDLRGRDSEFYVTIVGCVASYSAYLFFLLWISLAYFTKTQVLGVFAVSAALSTLLIQVAASASIGLALAVILFLPLLPIALGGLLLRSRTRGKGEEEGVAGESETLSSLVRNQRQRGLLPQVGPAGDGEEDDATAGRWSSRRQALMLAAALVLGVVAVRGIRRRLDLLDRAAHHAAEAQRCAAKAEEFEEEIANFEVVGPQPESRRQALPALKREAREWQRQADWYTRKSDEYHARWW